MLNRIRSTLDDCMRRRKREHKLQWSFQVVSPFWLIGTKEIPRKEKKKKKIKCLFMSSDKRNSDTWHTCKPLSLSKKVPLSLSL